MVVRFLSYLVNRGIAFPRHHEKTQTPNVTDVELEIHYPP